MNQTYDRKQGALLTRSEWLKMHNFFQDPFSDRAFQEETDSLWDQTFIPLPQIESILGTPEHPGYRFIFASDGGGKSSLRRYIKQEFERNLQKNIWPKVLPVEYIDHKYSNDQIGIHFHKVRVHDLLVNTFNEFQIDITLDTNNQLNLIGFLRNVVRHARDVGLDGICIILDNLNSPYRITSEQAFNRIQEIVSEFDIFTIHGLMVKILLPQEWLSYFQDRLSPKIFLPHYPIMWNENLLRNVLQQRLRMCSDSQVRKENYLSEIFVDDISSNIEDIFIKFGVLRNSPRAMWQLGYQVIDEHFRQSFDSSGRRFYNDLITTQLITQARNHLLGVYDTHKVSLVEPINNEMLNTQLRDLISKHFDLPELKVICFNLGIDYEEIAGDNKSITIINLYTYAHRRNLLSDLIKEFNKQRPQVKWPEIN